MQISLRFSCSHRGFKTALLAQTRMNPMNFKMKLKGICWLLSIIAMVTSVHKIVHSPLGDPTMRFTFWWSWDSAGHHPLVTLGAFGTACSLPGHCSVLSQQDLQSGEAPEVLWGENYLWAYNTARALQTCLLALLLGCAGVCEWCLLSCDLGNIYGKKHKHICWWKGYRYEITCLSYKLIGAEAILL